MMRQTGPDWRWHNLTSIITIDRQDNLILLTYHYSRLHDSKSLNVCNWEERTFVSLQMMFVSGQDTREHRALRSVNCVIISPRGGPGGSGPVFIMFMFTIVHSSRILVMDVVISAGGQTRQISNSCWISSNMIVNRRYKWWKAIFIVATDKSVKSVLTCEWPSNIVQEQHNKPSL